MSHRHVRSAALVALAIGVSAFGAAAANAASPAKVTPPASIKSANQLLFCSDITYPPEESYNGHDAQMDPTSTSATTLAAQDGREGALRQHRVRRHHRGATSEEMRCVISGMNDTPARRSRSLRRLPQVGQSFMVKKGNPENITGIDSPGRQDRLGRDRHDEQGLPRRTEQDGSRLPGQEGITVNTFPKDTDAANALRTGRVDAYFGDAPVVAYYIEQDAERVHVRWQGSQSDPGGHRDAQGRRPHRCHEEGRRQIYADGTMTKILAKWKMSAMALKR